MNRLRYYLPLVLLFPLNLSSAPLPDSPSMDSERAYCYTFREKQWRFFRSSPGLKLPRVGRIPELLLIPDNTFHTGIAAAINNPVKPPFEISFDYSTWDDDGNEWAVWNSADGLKMFFLKDASDYGTQPDGDSLGLSSDGGGYAVGFHLYGSRYVQLTGPQGVVLTRSHFARAYRQRQWVPVTVTVLTNRITVSADNKVILEQNLELDQQYQDIGFTAATGTADAEHAIRNLCIKALPSDQSEEESSRIPPQQQEGFIPAPGLEDIDTWPAQP